MRRRSQRGLRWLRGMACRMMMRLRIMRSSSAWISMIRWIGVCCGLLSRGCWHLCLCLGRRWRTPMTTYCTTTRRRKSRRTSTHVIQPTAFSTRRREGKSSTIRVCLQDSRRKWGKNIVRIRIKIMSKIPNRKAALRVKNNTWSNCMVRTRIANWTNSMLMSRLSMGGANIQRLKVVTFR